MQEKGIFYGVFGANGNFRSIGIIVLVGTWRSLVTRQTQLSLETEISIQTSNPYKILIWYPYRTWLFEGTRSTRRRSFNANRRLLKAQEARDVVLLTQNVV